MRSPARHRRPVTRYATTTITTTLALFAVITAGPAITTPDTPERASHRPASMPGPRGQ